MTKDEDRAWPEWVQHIREDTVRKIAASSHVISIAPTNDGPDIKLAVELGLAILLNKPIVALSIRGTPIPEGMRRVADHVIEVGDIDTEAGRLEMQRKLMPILAKAGRKRN